MSCDVTEPGRGESVTVDVAETVAMNLMEITAPGPLQSRIVAGKACFWFVAVNGTDISIVWPARSTARTDPLRILDGEGEVIAATGQVGLSFSGSFLEDRTGCSGPGSQVFVAGAVTRPP